jgi:hypothetical protein
MSEATTPAADPHLGWDKGGTARLLSITKDGAVTLRSSVPSPPGSRIDGTLTNGGVKVRFKIHGSRKQPEGDFILEGRAIDMTREVRELLEGLLAPSPA